MDSSERERESTWSDLPISSYPTRISLLNTHTHIHTHTHTHTHRP
ncbi:hypothetical protein OAV88_02005 [bacterium]|nr:hypothetical protein [bacterium]